MANSSRFVQYLLLVLCSSAIIVAANDDLVNHELPDGLVAQSIPAKSPKVKRTIRVAEVSPPDAGSVADNVDYNDSVDLDEVQALLDAQNSANNLAAFQSGNVHDVTKLDSENMVQNSAFNSGNMISNTGENNNNVKHHVMTNSGNTEVVHMDGVGNSKVTKISNSGNNESVEHEGNHTHRSERPSTRLGSPVLGHPLRPNNPLVQINMNEMGAARFEQPAASPMWQAPPFYPTPAQPFQFGSWPSVAGLPAPRFAGPVPSFAPMQRRMLPNGNVAMRPYPMMPSNPMMIQSQPPFVMAPMSQPMVPMVQQMMQPMMMMPAVWQPMSPMMLNPYAVDRLERRRRLREKSLLEEQKRKSGKKNKRVEVPDEKDEDERPRKKPAPTVIKEKIVPVPLPMPPPTTTTTTPAPEPEEEIEYETIRVPKGQLKQIPGFDPTNVIKS